MKSIPSHYVIQKAEFSFQFVNEINSNLPFDSFLDFLFSI